MFIPESRVKTKMSAKSESTKQFSTLWLSLEISFTSKSKQTYKSFWTDLKRRQLWTAPYIMYTTCPNNFFHTFCFVIYLPFSNTALAKIMRRLAAWKN